MTTFRDMLRDSKISDALIPLDYTEADCEKLHKLIQHYKRFYGGIVISATWELYALVGKFEKIAKPADIPRIIAMVLSGNPAGLEWLCKNYSNDNNFDHIFFYAALSGNTEALDYIYNQPCLEKLAHNITQHIESIVHFTVASGNPQAFAWVYAKYPEKFYRGERTACYAAIFNNPEPFNLCLALSKKPSEYSLSIYTQDAELECILNALASNYSLLAIKNIDLTYKKGVNIEKLLARNAKILTAIAEFKKSLNDDPNNLIWQIESVAIGIFRELLPEGIPHHISLDLFKEITNMHYAQNKTNSRLVRSEMIRLANSSSIFGSDPTAKIRALQKLETILQNPDTKFNADHFKSWYQEHKSVLNKQRNTLHKFFDPHHISRTEKTLIKIFKSLNIEMEHLESLGEATASNQVHC